MLNKKRNPFPAVGKVFKYEFFSTARVFIPIYAAIFGLSLVIALVTKLTFDPDKVSYSSLFGKSIVYGSEPLDFLFRSLIVLMSGASVVVTAIMLKNRFVKSMLGQEAYLNLTLPVSVGEHLAGRVLVDLAWICILSVVLFVSSLAINMSRAVSLDLFFQSIRISVVNMTDMEVLPSIAVVLPAGIMYYVLVISFVYLVCTIGSLVNRKKALLRLGSAFGLLVVYSNVSSFCRIAFYETFEPLVWEVLLTSMAINLVLSGINFFFTYLILHKRPNLE